MKTKEQITKRMDFKKWDGIEFTAKDVFPEAETYDTFFELETCPCPDCRSTGDIEVVTKEGDCETCHGAGEIFL